MNSLARPPRDLDRVTSPCKKRMGGQLEKAMIVFNPVELDMLKT